MDHHLWLGVVLIFALLRGSKCLRNISLEIVPKAVQRGQEAILRCRYDLGEAPLYSVKWYRGKHEFYRYTPKDSPSTKTFSIPGINVDVSNSNGTQVMLRNVEYRLSGNFSCEVTADAPSFSTAVVIKYLNVVSLPRSKPVISSNRIRDDSGEILKVNCTSPPSKPPVDLYFTLNNVPIDRGSTKRRVIDAGPGQQPQTQGSSNQGVNLQWIDISTDIHLTPSHYVNGQLTLRCFAEIPDIYSSQSDVLQLGSGLREPVPERVTSENGCPSSSVTSISFLFCVGALQMMLR